MAMRIKRHEWNWGENDKLKVYTRLSGGEVTSMEVQYQKTVPQKYYDAVADTRGLVLRYAGHVVNAPYHSTCGGSTAAVSEVWIWPRSAICLGTLTYPSPACTSIATFAPSGPLWASSPTSR